MPRGRPTPYRNGRRSFTREQAIDALRRFKRLFRMAPLSSHVYWGKIIEERLEKEFPAPRKLWWFFPNMIKAWLAAGIEPDYPCCKDCRKPIPVKRSDSRRTACDDCGVRLRCLARQASDKRKYAFTDKIDGEIERIYRDEPNKKSMRKLADKLGWPRWVLTKRAGDLGVARIKETPWSKAELDLLRELHWMTPHTMAGKFKERGFHRSKTAINLMLKRKDARADSGWWSPNLFAKAIGLDSHCITRWLELGWLPFEIKQLRSERQGGDMRAVREVDIYIFLVTHRHDYDLRKVNQQWLLSMLIDFPQKHTRNIKTRLEERGMKLEQPEYDYTRSLFPRKKFNRPDRRSKNMSAQSNAGGSTFATPAEQESQSAARTRA
jgi:hypothetical protein